MPAYRAVLFDLDGTLIDTNDLILTTFRHVLREQLGLEVEPRDLIPYFGEPLRTTVARFAPPERVDEVVAAYRAYNHAHHDRLARPVPGMAEVLAALRAAGVRLAVTTSKLSEGARRGLRLFGLEPFFEAVVGLEATARHKPDPEPVLRTLERLGLPAGPDVLMVGDSPYDIESGRRAGVRTAAVAWSLHDRAELQARQPDYWVRTPAELVSLCLGPGTLYSMKPS
ncbi:HAD family hydrolase [Caldinitratiruptor microaerophilus]|uniref:Haloacid dehalogenase n=1 Tax=Caldinitratiruptor microaerophilus TaxID=671077 RepID=A0AA35CP25_9FIRM|nr:HAD family hydrolase [Caldinitratiruptor microaerophilus]BDG62108.1 haloacid dehalogenase [Caldinitratiruptor microaerophilus]